LPSLPERTTPPRAARSFCSSWFSPDRSSSNEHASRFTSRGRCGDNGPDARLSPPAPAR
jgi:hypothetical protein